VVNIVPFFTSTTNNNTKNESFVEAEDYRGYRVEVHYDFDAEKPNDSRMAQALSLVCRWTQEIGYGFQSL